MKNQPHILFLTQAKPFSGVGGENMRSRGLISILQANKYSITAITGSEGDTIAEENNLFAHYKVLDLKNSFFAKFNSLFKTDSAIVSAINEVHQMRKIDVAFIDYMFMGQYISILKKMGIPVIYGTHNAQADLTHQELKTLSGITRIIRWGAWRLQRIHERRYFPLADKLIVVSHIDKQYHKAFCNPTRIEIIPNFLDQKEYIQLTNKENYFVISGNFNSYQNRVGTEWFLMNIWPECYTKNITLKLAGLNSDSFLEQMLQSNQLQNIEATGEITNINEVIAKAKASLVPLQQGSGSRFKILESLASGTLVVSTTLGAIGINSSAIYIANTKKEFIKTIDKIILNKVNIKPELPKENTIDKYICHIQNMINSTILKESSK